MKWIDRPNQFKPLLLIQFRFSSLLGQSDLMNMPNSKCDNSHWVNLIWMQITLWIRKVHQSFSNPMPLEWARFANYSTVSRSAYTFIPFSIIPSPFSFTLHFYWYLPYIWFPFRFHIKLLANCGIVLTCCNILSNIILCLSHNIILTNCYN